MDDYIEGTDAKGYILEALDRIWKDAMFAATLSYDCQRNDFVRMEDCEQLHKALLRACTYANSIKMIQKDVELMATAFNRQDKEEMKNKEEIEDGN